MNKFTNNGKGPLHPRFFKVDPSSIKVIQFYGYCTLNKVSSPNNCTDLLVKGQGCKQQRQEIWWVIQLLSMF